ncbi:MAG: rhomboid family intramembrane serine protease [Ginsengibacter sp.]
MSESERYLGYRRKKISFGADGNALMTLVSINGVVFLALIFLRIIFYITQTSTKFFNITVEPWVALPASLSQLLVRPWTFLVYMFSHTSLIMAFTNMLWLWAFGSIFQSVAGNKKLIPLYLYGGIVGAVVFMGCYNLIPPLKPDLASATLLGASASTMAIAVATTALTPDYKFFRMLNGGIPIWVLTVLYMIVDFAGIATESAAYSFAHFAGGLTGFFFVYSLRKGYDWSAWMNNLYDWFMNLFTPKPQSIPQKKLREKMFYKSGDQKAFVKRSNITQQRIDEILDKINQKGYNLLTEEEKNILKGASEADF